MPEQSSSRYELTRHLQGLELTADSFDGLQAPDLVSRRIEATKRRIEQEVDRRCLELFKRQERIEKRKALLAQLEAELKKPLSYDWRNERWVMYQVPRSFY